MAGRRELTQGRLYGIVDFAKGKRFFILPLTELYSLQLDKMVSNDAKNVDY